MLTLALSDSIWLFLTLLGSLWLPWTPKVLARLKTPWPRGHILSRPGTASSFHFLIFCGFYLAIGNSQPQETALIAKHALSIRLIIQLVLWDTSLATTTSMILIVFEDKIRLARHLLDTRSLVTRFNHNMGSADLLNKITTEHNKADEPAQLAHEQLIAT